MKVSQMLEHPIDHDAARLARSLARSPARSPPESFSADCNRVGERERQGGRMRERQSRRKRDNQLLASLGHSSLYSSRRLSRLILTFIVREELQLIAPRRASTPLLSRRESNSFRNSPILPANNSWNQTDDADVIME